LLILRQMRNHFDRAGYTAQDLQEIFQELDSNCDYMLSFEEFRQLLPLLKINMSTDNASRIFQEFDQAGEGTIDFQCFLMGIFPAHRFFRKRVGVRGRTQPNSGQRLQIEEPEIRHELSSTEEMEDEQASRSAQDSSEEFGHL